MNTKVRVWFLATAVIDVIMAVAMGAIGNYGASAGWGLAAFANFILAFGVEKMKGE